MIVRDESAVIERCLASALGLISSYSIVDTGSTDGTPEIIQRFFREHSVPGAVYRRPWRDFATNRTEALTLAAPSDGQGAFQLNQRADYDLMIDADDVFETAPGFDAGMVLDRPDARSSYEIRFEGDVTPSGGPLTYYRPQLTRNGAGFRYEGVHHEYIPQEQLHDMGRLHGLVIRRMGGGARSKIGVRAKYLADARVLQAALKREPHNRRYALYLAESYYYAGEYQKALYAYDRRLHMARDESWASPETYWAALQRARLLEGMRSSETTEAYLFAFALRPQRADAIYELARYYAAEQNFALAWLYARAGVTIPHSDDAFTDESITDWRMLDLLATSAFAIGRVDEARAAWKELIGRPKLPEVEANQIRAHLAALR